MRYCGWILGGLRRIGVLLSGRGNKKEEEMLLSWGHLACLLYFYVVLCYSFVLERRNKLELSDDHYVPCERQFRSVKKMLFQGF